MGSHPNMINSMMFSNSVHQPVHSNRMLPPPAIHSLGVPDVVFQPVPSNRMHLPPLISSRPRTPDIFEDAESSDDNTNWRELYANNKRINLYQVPKFVRSFDINPTYQINESIASSSKRKISTIK